MNLLQVFDASKSFGSKTLFDAVSFSINEGEHIGVIGPNGAGKSTLFKILAEQTEFDSGQLTKKNGLRIGYLEQESEWDVNLTVEEYLSQNTSTPLWKLKKLGLSLGLQESSFDKKISLLSGGFRMRVKLLHLIGLEPDLLLLDEPTNFLDLESILALESFLQGYERAFLLISHDRDFLRRTTEYTLEVEDKNIVKFSGHIDDYFEQKEELKQHQLAEAQNQAIKRKHLQDFVDRFRAKATKARQAQSRLKQLEKMDVIEIKKAPVKASIKLPQPTPTGKEILQLKNAHLGYNTDTPVVTQVNLRIERGQKIGIVGFNGAGKSTLLKSIAAKIPLLSGELILGHNVRISYFAQHLAEELLPTDTILDSLERKAHIDCTRQDILNIAGSLLFSGDDIYKKISVLSGGEKTRVALGQMLLQRNPVLVMDEPTNHLDFDTVNALAQSLEDFEGTTIVVSHDRHFIRQISKQILEIRDGKAELYPGSYDDYLWSLQKGSMKERFEGHSDNNLENQYKQPPQVAPSNTAPAEKVNYKAEQKRLNSEVKELERKILKTEDILFELGKKLEDINQQLITSKGLGAQSLSKEASQLSTQIADSEEVLLSHMSSLEEAQNLLTQLTQKT